jgi:hypothetical protein
MRWHWHQWETVHKEIVDDCGWFAHEHCVCGRDRIREHMSFFGTINDAMTLGIAVGLYKGFYLFRTGKEPHWDEK